MAGPDAFNYSAPMLDLTPRLSDPAVLALLALSVYPDPARLEQARRRYLEETDWRLLGLEESALLVGSIGLELSGPGQATIQHIGVVEAQRGQGVGRRLIERASVQLRLDTLQAETDAEAAQFYRRCGFIVTSLGERYPGVKRFRCIRRRT
jgi:ribosomal protein S18 acetylase RimI-like enzyme